MSALRWTCKSLRRLAAELQAQGHAISHTMVGELLTQQKFSLQSLPLRRRGPIARPKKAAIIRIGTLSSAISSRA